ncbi:MAG: hypothetical protein NWF10_06750 [Candidatus Bathyarchaeota archaeon]|nr:hypothetical protein [Candidatus Bathyarchaeota archaeon]
MISISEEEPFKDLEVVKADVKRCAWASGILSVLSLLFVLVGVVGDVLDMSLGLETMSWFLLAIVVAVNAIVPLMNSVVAKLLFGIKSENK